MRKWCLLLVAFLSAATTLESIHGDESILKVVHPKSLFKKSGYRHRKALFVVPNHGSTIQNVHYAESDLCHPLDDNLKLRPLRAKDEKGTLKPWSSPFILMVDRGNCTFIQKVRNAQKLRAVGVIIADNTCLCSDTECLSTYKITECETLYPMIPEDYYDEDIFIPSVLMYKQDADTVKAVLQSNQMVQMEMKWPIPSPQGQVGYDLWAMPADFESKIFLQNFKNVALALGNRGYFTPHPYIYDGIESGCRGADGENMCQDICTENGRYCAAVPENYLDRGVFGSDVVRESLRWICIRKIFGKGDGIGKEWWDYVSEFFRRCDTSAGHYFSNDDCINDAYWHSGVAGDAVEKCMTHSGSLTADLPNPLLEMEIAFRNQLGVHEYPKVLVDSVLLDGSVKVSTVFDAICSGYLTGHDEPLICAKCAKASDKLGCISNDHGKETSSSIEEGEHGGRVGFRFLLICFILCSFGFFLWKRQGKKGTRDHSPEYKKKLYFPLKAIRTIGSDCDECCSDYVR